MIERPKQTKSSELVAMMLIDTHVDVALDVALSGGGRRDRSAGYGLAWRVAKLIGLAVATTSCYFYDSVAIEPVEPFCARDFTAIHKPKARCAIVDVCACH